MDDLFAHKGDTLRELYLEYLKYYCEKQNRVTRLYVANSYKAETSPTSPTVLSEF